MGLPLLQILPLNPTSESVNLMSPSRVKMAALAKRDPEDLWWVPLGKAPVV